MDFAKHTFISTVVVTLFLVSTMKAQSYDFNSGTTQGWTLDQMYETSTQKKITPFTSFSLSNQNNQLAASVSPLLIGNPAIKSYDIYLESPDVSSNTNWQNISGYSIDLQRTLDSPCGHPPNVYFAQLQMKVIDTADNNNEKLFAEHNGSNFVFHHIAFGKSYHFVWKPSFLTDPKYKVKTIRIRLTGPGDPGPGSGECAPKGSWLLDNVKAEGGISTSSITVDIPNGGEVWEADTPHFIRWHSQNFSNPVKIEYSTNGGGTYSTIVASTPNDGTHEWMVPNAPTTQGRVRISDASSGNPSDVSDANFTITATEAIFVDVPNGGESWEAGTPRYIVWHNNLFSDPVKIEYSTNGGSSYTTITASTANTGSYQWTVPNAPSNQCRVRISDASDGNPADVSDSDFAITATESITLDVPNGGENWEVGSPRYIVWHNHLFSDPVKIEYSTNGGSSYATIVQSTPNTGSFKWTIPDAPSSTCLVRISDASDGNPSDESDASFTISSSAQTNTPPGSNIHVPLGSGVEVTFASVISGGTTSLEIKTSGTPAPAGMVVLPLTDPQYFDITSTAGFTTSVEVCIEYDPANLSTEQLANLTLQVYEDTPGQWNNITTAHNVGAQIVCGSVGHLSEFAVMTPGSAPTITVISPNGNEVWPVGSQQEIRWTSSDFTDPVRIEYSIDGNASHLDVISSTENDGSYLWAIPNTPSNQCVVIISDAADGQPFDISDAVFTITSEPAGEDLVVTNTLDSGAGSLRTAILAANASPEPDTIRFAIPDSDAGYDADMDVWTLRPVTPLPVITGFGLFIDGRSQVEFIGEDRNPTGPEIQIDGRNAGVNAHGLSVRAPDVRISDMAINRFRGAGIFIYDSEAVHVTGCYLGIEASGFVPAGNEFGLWVTGHSWGTFVAPSELSPNIISGNVNAGIFISDSCFFAAILGNIIGPALDRTSHLGNGLHGIGIQENCGHIEIIDNLICGNSNGIYVADSDSNHIAGNRIGTDESWEIDIGNGANGVMITGTSSDNFVGENTIGYNVENGIHVFGEQAIRNELVGNRISKNGGAAIITTFGGNGELSPPMILNVTEELITGSAGSDQFIELFADEEDEAQIWLGVSFSDAEGNFTFSSGEPLPSLPYVTATATDADGNTSQLSTPFSVTSVDTRGDRTLPTTFALHQNYPNPFNPTTRIEYELPKASHVTIRIYNLSGQKVRTLLDGIKQVGIHRITWDGRNHRGLKVGSGLYVVRIVAGEFVACRKMALIR